MFYIKEVKKINKREFGNIGEDIACKYLKNIGYRIIERNFSCKQGEIDIVAKDKNEYVFIEVKTRKNVFYVFDVLRRSESVYKYSGCILCF